MERGDYWSALVRGWWLIVIFAVGGLVVGLSLPKLGPASQTHFESQSIFGSPPPQSNNQASLFGGGIDTDQIQYYAKTDRVMIWTNQLSGLNESIAYVRDQINLVGPAEGPGSQNAPSSGQAGAIDVKVTSPTSAQALALNNAFDEAMEFEVADVATTSLNGEIAQTEAILVRVLFEIYTNHYPFGVTQPALQVQVNRLQDELASLVIQTPSTGFSVLQQPEATTITKVHTSSVFSKRPVRAAAGLGAGLILGALAALGLWLLDKRLKTAKRAQAALAYPVVAEIPSDSSDATEPYRMLWLSVFREPLPLPPAEQNQRLYEGEDPVLESGVGGRPPP